MSHLLILERDCVVLDHPQQIKNAALAATQPRSGFRSCAGQSAVPRCYQRNYGWIKKISDEVKASWREPDLHVPYGDEKNKRLFPIKSPPSN